jgi:hypothetical protein
MIHFSTYFIFVDRTLLGKTNMALLYGAIGAKNAGGINL